MFTSRPADDAPHRHLRVAAIVDEFTRASLAPEVELLNLDARRWPLELARFRPDFVFVESAWNGKDSRWKGKVASYPNRRRSVRISALKAACRVAKIPTVFWNKEDPIHYDRFLASARGFDVVLTTAVEKIDDYRRDLGLAEHQVGALPFGVQTRIYSAGSGARQPRAVFAGSYGESHFPQRRIELERVLDGAIAAGIELDIFDRTAETRDPDKRFPDRFNRYIRGFRRYDKLADEYRRSAVGLNVNSIRDSRTMFSRRVFEMLACGMPVVSGPGLGMDELLPGLVTTVQSVDEARDAISSAQPLEPEQIDWVCSEHSMAARVGTIARFL